MMRDSPDVLPWIACSRYTSADQLTQDCSGVANQRQCGIRRADSLRSRVEMDQALGSLRLC